jgi:hypothetical protein
LEDYRVEIGGVEEELTETYLLATTSHDGTSACRVMATKVRVVCNNTLEIALRGVNNVYSIKHLGYVETRVAEARESLGLTLKWDKSITEALNMMADVRCDEDTFTVLQEQLWPYDEENDTDDAIGNALDKRVQLDELYSKFNDEGSPLAGTRYAALQAATEQLDWYSRVITSSSENERRFQKLIDRNHVPQKGLAFAILAD